MASASAVSPPKADIAFGELVEPFYETMPAFGELGSPAAPPVGI